MKTKPQFTLIAASILVITPMLGGQVAHAESVLGQVSFVSTSYNESTFNSSLSSLENELTSREPISPTGSNSDNPSNTDSDSAPQFSWDSGNLTKPGDFRSSEDLFHSIEHVPAVPEPETYAMLLAGLTMLGLVARRRKNSSK